MLECILDDWPGRAETITAPPVLDRAAVAVPDAPGLGVDIDEAFIVAPLSVRNVSIAGGGYEPGTASERVRADAAAPRRPAFQRKDKGKP